MKNVFLSAVLLLSSCIGMAYTDKDEVKVDAEEVEIPDDFCTQEEYTQSCNVKCWLPALACGGLSLGARCYAYQCTRDGLGCAGTCTGVCGWADARAPGSCSPTNPSP